MVRTRGSLTLNAQGFLVANTVTLSSPVVIEMKVQALGSFSIQGKSVAQISLLLIVLECYISHKFVEVFSPSLIY